MAKFAARGGCLESEWTTPRRGDALSAARHLALLPGQRLPPGLQCRIAFGPCFEVSVNFLEETQFDVSSSS